MGSEEVTRAIAETRTRLGVERLSFREFLEASQISRRTVLRHFDSWSEACAAAGVECGSNDNLVPNAPVSKQECLDELRRVAGGLGRGYISQEEFNALSRFNAVTPIRRFGSWAAALQAAGLRLGPQVFREVPLDALAREFLRVAVEIGAVPTLRQIDRRSQYGEYLFSAKHGGYSAFKSKALKHLQDEGVALPQFLAEIPLPPTKPAEPAPARSHEHGRVLGFRAFAHEPTYEQEVVGIFSVTAEELGFDITCLREAFPDCEARRRVPGRRRRYKRCLIEFELYSSDYVRHRHPVNGCDLIVCWVHDWQDSPLEVLELRSAIRSLPGWR